MLVCSLGTYGSWFQRKTDLLTPDTVRRQYLEVNDCSQGLFTPGSITSFEIRLLTEQVII